MISATCLKPMLSSEPVLLVSFCQAVERISPETMPHRISLVVGTRRLVIWSVTVPCVVESADPVVPFLLPVVVPVMVPPAVDEPPDEFAPALKLVMKLLRSV